MDVEEAATADHTANKPEPGMPVGEDAASDGQVPKRERRTLLAIFLLFAALFGMSTGGHTGSIDEELMVSQTRAFAHGDPNVQYVEPLFTQLYRARSDGTSSIVYGAGQSVIGLPAYAIGRILGGFEHDNSASFVEYVSIMMTNSVVTALIVVGVILLARELGADFRVAVALGIAYGLGTFAYPAAKTFGSEAAAALCLLAAAWWCIRRAGDRGTNFMIAAGLATLSASFRVSTLAMIPVFAVYMLVEAIRSRDRGSVSWILRAMLGGAAGLALLGLSNWWRYESAFDIGYETVDVSYPVVKGLFNLYFSIGKSVFEFAPVLIVVVAALVVFRRKIDRRHVLLIALIAVNSITIARLSVWSGDHTWGPRYLLVTLPVSVALGAVIEPTVRWLRTIRVATAVGFVFAAMAGVLVYFNMFLIRAIDEIGGAPVASEDGQPAYIVKVRSDLSWNQIIGHLELLPDATRDVFVNGGDGTPDRGTYFADPATHYGYFGLRPRLDLWWLWARPANGSFAVYWWAVIWLASAIAGARLLRRPHSRAEGSIDG